jgi:phospholipase/lecithinase/hemolysin
MTADCFSSSPNPGRRARNAKGGAFWRRLAVLLFLGAAISGHASGYTGVVAFGDSLSDMGNRWLDPNKPDMAFRRTWVAQLAGPDMLNLPGFKPSGISAFYGGHNYAVGGAGTEYTAAQASERNRGQHLSQQVSRRYLNPAFNTDGVQKEALHVIVIGANDIMLASIGLDQIAAQWANLDQAGRGVARSVEGQIRALAAAGATRVLWGNVFDVAQAPSVVKRARWVGPLSATYLAAVTAAVRTHNAEMDDAIRRLRAECPALCIMKLDLFACFAAIAASPTTYGLEDVTTGANDSKHLFSADGLHPTQKGHRLLAEFAFNTLTGARSAEDGAR